MSPRPRCMWFALCPNKADGQVEHPILGPVSCCKRCADNLGLDLKPFADSFWTQEED